MNVWGNFPTQILGDEGTTQHCDREGSVCFKPASASLDFGNKLHLESVISYVPLNEERGMDSE